MKFLIDECLSPELAQLALENEHGETSVVCGALLELRCSNEGSGCHLPPFSKRRTQSSA